MVRPSNSLSKWDPFLRLHSEEPLEGNSSVIFSLETQTSKNAAPKLGQQPELSDAHARDYISWVTSQNVTTLNHFHTLHATA